MSADASRVLALLQRHGWNATSFQTLEPGFTYWFDDDAVVAYVDTAGAWIAAGAPIAAEHALAATADRFCAVARTQGKRVCFFGPEQRFLNAWHGRSLLVGEQPVWDPRAWPALLASHRSLREQLRRAKAKGVQVRRVDSASLDRARVERLIARWRVSRPMAPMAFLVQVEPFAFADERRYFVAEKDGEVVGFLALVPIYARNGWLLDDLVRDPQAPNGTAESLIDAAMQDLARSGCAYATLGLAPLAGAVGGTLRMVRRASRDLYDFNGLHAFKAKLRPQRWDAIHVAYERSSALALLDVLRAFASGQLWRFGLATLMRGPAVVLRLLTVLLVPWTLALALAPRSYFPWPWVQYAWIGFDVALAAALFFLTQRYRPRLATALAWIVSADALITCVEALAYQRMAHPVVAIVAVCGPAFSAFLLWRARLHSL